MGQDKQTNTKGMAMKNLIILIIIATGAYYTYLNFSTASGVYDDSGNAKTLLFLYEGCGAPCNQAERFLQDTDIQYERINLSSGPEAEDRLRSLRGSSTMPQLYTGSRRVDGFHHLRYKEALGETYGLKVLSGKYQDAYASHFYDDGSPKLVMYGASWCPYCLKAREYFVDNGLNFKEWDVEKEFVGKRHFETLEGTGYPVIYVGFRRVNTDDVKTALRQHPNLL